MVAFGGVMVGLGWVINSIAESLTMLYAGAVVSGIGGGAVYATSVGHAVKWFPDRRGLAVGLTAAGYGAGAALTVIPIRHVIDTSGYEAAFLWFGLIQGGGGFRSGLAAARSGTGGDPQHRGTQGHAVDAKLFAARGAANPGVLASLHHVRDGFGQRPDGNGTDRAHCQATSVSPNAVLLFGGTTLTVALIVDNVANGAARPLFGWISDNIGREYTMAIAFGLGGVAYWLLGSLGTAPWAFVVFAAMIFLTWGEIFSLFPSTCTDTFGPKFATVNLSLLYTAKGTSAFLTPVANMIKDATGSWHMVFLVTTIMNFAVVGLALFVLRPMRRQRNGAKVNHLAPRLGAVRPHGRGPEWAWRGRTGARKSADRLRATSWRTVRDRLRDIREFARALPA